MTDTVPDRMGGRTYTRWLREDMRQMVEYIDLTKLQKHYILSRWLEQVIWMESRAQNARRVYYTLKLTAIVGGLIVPSLVGLNALNGFLGDIIYWMIFFISLTASISVGLEEFMRYGDRWRHYRSIVEEMKIVGWQYFQLAGRFKDYSSHKLAYVTFVNTVESIIQREVQVFVSNVSAEHQKDDDDKQETTSMTDATNQVPEPAAQTPLPRLTGEHEVKDSVTPLYPRAG